MLAPETQWQITSRFNMKKLLLIFALLAGTVNAEVWVKQITLPDGNGYAFRFDDKCWVMPEWVDLNYFDSAWMTVADTALLHSWPAADDATIAACTGGPRVYKTSFTQMYGLDNNGQLIVTGTVPLGTPCGERMSDITFLRTVTYGGRFGFGICI